jgi:hypothetical protein
MAILKTKKNNDSRIDKMRGKLKTPRKVNLIVDADLFKRFKAKTAAGDVTMTSIVIKAMEEYLKK